MFDTVLSKNKRNYKCIVCHYGTDHTFTIGLSMWHLCRISNPCRSCFCSGVTELLLKQYCIFLNSSVSVLLTRIFSSKFNSAILFGSFCCNIPNTSIKFFGRPFKTSVAHISKPRRPGWSTHATISSQNCTFSKESGKQYGSLSRTADTMSNTLTVTEHLILLKLSASHGVGARVLSSPVFDEERVTESASHRLTFCMKYMTASNILQNKNGESINIFSEIVIINSHILQYMA